MHNDRIVLVLDDDPSFSAELRTRLADRECRAIAVSAPAALIEELRAARYRVVLIDLGMPGINGLKLLSEIKRFDGSLLVIALVRAADQGTALAALRCGAEDCVLKEASSALLLDAIDAAFGKIERWWASLRNLADWKRTHKNTCQAPSVPATMDDEGEKRRLWTRYAPVGGELAVLIDGQAHPAAIVDTSFGGIGIRLPSRQGIEVGQLLDLHHGDSTIHGIVRWVRQEESGNYRVGIQWPEKQVPAESGNACIPVSALSSHAVCPPTAPLSHL